MSDIRPAREMRYAESAGEGFVNTRAFEWLSRAGFVARAAIYAIIGVLALKLAIGEGGKLTDQQGALKTFAGQPFGSILLTLLAIGLGGAIAATRLLTKMLFEVKPTDPMTYFGVACRFSSGTGAFMLPEVS